MTIERPAVPAPADPLELLTAWRPDGATWFSGPRASLLTRGCHRVVPAAEPDALDAVLGEVAREGAAPAMVVGALPFDPAGAPALIVPRWARWGRPLADAVPPPPVVAPTPAERRREVAPAGEGSVRAVPAPQEYEAMVAEARSRMAGGGLDKVVLSRLLELTTRHRVDVPATLRALAARDPRGFLFALGLPGAGPDPRTFLGASPELLVSRRGDTVCAQPLAGSAPRHPDPVEDERLGAELLASAKNRHEHDLVIAPIVEALAPWCVELEVPPEPSLVRTDALWHLGTRIRGRVAPEVSALTLARALHPTPAVGGVPDAAARRAIAEIEPFDRGFYTGMVGWTDVTGDGEWVIALRCSEVQGHAVRLHAGAGIVPDSDPAAELAETSVKLRTQLRALGLADAGAP